MYLGVKAVIVKSLERIHRANLVNFGILPLTFVNPDDYDTIEQGDELEIVEPSSITSVESLTVKNLTKNVSFEVSHNLSSRQLDIILSGGVIRTFKQ